jgi:hypothetical protein
MQVQGNARAFRPAVWQKKRPDVFSACFFKTRLHAAAQISIQPPAEAAEENRQIVIFLV